MEFTSLKPEDFEVLERLLESYLPKKDRETLLKKFGKDSHRSEVHRIQEKRYQTCDRDCLVCNMCMPYMEEPLLYLIVEEMKDFRYERENERKQEFEAIDF